MTFDSVTYRSQSSPYEDLPGQSDRHAGSTHSNRRAKTAASQEDSYGYCEDTEIANWHNEGGAHFARPPCVSRRDSLGSKSMLTEHIDTAEALIESGDYDGAFSELKQAADRYMNYRDMINQTVNASIARLSTPGCRATGPHPKALSLVRLRQHITS